jgi:hypothetical protein
VSSFDFIIAQVSALIQKELQRGASLVGANCHPKNPSAFSHRR